MSTGSQWLDRVLAGLGGACAFMAFRYYVSGDIIGGTVGVVLVLAALWLCAPPRPHRMKLQDILTAHARESFIRRLSAVYGVDSAEAMAADIPAGGWDPFGTPIVWCRVEAIHEPHLWENMGPAYAPVLCIGHECANSDAHMETA